MNTPSTMLTLQGIFSKTYKHILQQGPALVALGMCNAVPGAAQRSAFRPMYRTPEGKSCAVGVHIPDELYRPEFDAPEYGSSVISAIWMFRPAHAKVFFAALLAGGVDIALTGRITEKPALSLLVGLQREHDKFARQGFTLDDWKINMACLAARWKLEVP